MPKNDKATRAKRELVLNAAANILTKQGIQSLSFETVANKAGLSRQLIRYYYSDLDALVVDLVDHLGNEYQGVLVAGILKVGEVERLKFLLDFFFGVAEDYPMPDNLEAYDGLFAYAVGSESTKERLHVKYRTLAQVIRHELAIAHTELDSSACEELSFLFVSMMHAHWSFIATLGFSKQHNRVARDAFDRIIASYVESCTNGQ